MSETLDKYDEHHNRQQGKRLAYVLSSDKISEDTQDAISNILFNAFSESGLSLDDPEFIEISYPVLLENLNRQYGNAIDASVTALIDSTERRSAEVQKDLQQFDVPLREYKAHNKLKFKSSLEEFSKVADASELGAILAGLLENESLPAAIDDQLRRALNDVYNNLNTSPDISEIDEFEDFSANYNALLIALHNKQNDEPKQVVLDLSEQPENLNLLANQISEVLRHPATPSEVKICIKNELNDIPEAFSSSPEWILENLKRRGGK